MQNRRVDFYLTDNQDHTNGNESVDDLTKRLAEFFSEYKLGFSLSHIIGGYISDDGKFVIEKSIRVTAMGLYSDEQFKLFTDGFKKLFNQESVLVCKQRVETNYY